MNEEIHRTNLLSSWLSGGGDRPMPVVDDPYAVQRICPLGPLYGGFGRRDLPKRVGGQLDRRKQDRVSAQSGNLANTLSLFPATEPEKKPPATPKRSGGHGAAAPGLQAVC